MSAGGETEILLMAGAILRLATPLLLAALAGLFAERAGVIDLSLEGKMLVGAFAAAAVAAITGSAAVGMLAAIAAAILLSLLHGIATVSRPGNQVISGMAINIIAAGLVPTLANAMFDLGGGTPPLTGAARIVGHAWPFADWAARQGLLGRIYATVIGGHNSLVYLALLLVPVSHSLLYRTGWGLRLRAAGENPEAVAAAGGNVTRIRYQALIVNGVLCGLAGAYLSLAANAGFTRDITAGKGYLAVAALILGRWKPGLALAACWLFSAADAIQSVIQHTPLPGVGLIPAPWVTALPYILTVIVLAVTGRGVSIPKALGVPFAKTR